MEQTRQISRNKKEMLWRSRLRAKAASVLLAVAMLITALAGCGGEKTPVSPEEFRSQMEEAGLQVVDQTENAPEDSGMTTVLVALEENRYQVELYVFKDENSAKSLYDTTKNGLQSNYEDVSGKVETSRDSGSYSKYTIQVDGGYVSVARIGDTLVYAKGLSEYKDDVRDAVEKLGY